MQSRFRSVRLMVVLSSCWLALVFGLPGKARAVTLSYPDFSSVAGLTLNGDAAQLGSVLRVTPATWSQAGSVFSTSPLSLSLDASFSTSFQFRFTNAGAWCDPVGSCGGDGLVFVLQTVSNSVGTGGGGIGYQGIPNSVGIEFDTWNNPADDGISSNHVGVNVGGAMNSLLRTDVTAGDMNDGGIWYAWIDYDDASDLLEVRLSQTATQPASPLLSLTRDLVLDLGSTSAYVGFTSGTGSAYANHDVLSWNFATVPEPGTVLLLGSGLAGLASIGRPKRRRRSRTRAGLAFACAAGLGVAGPATALQISLSPTAAIGGSGAFGGSLNLTTPWNVGGASAGNVFDSQGPGPKFESPQTTGSAWHGNDGDRAEYFVIDLGASYVLSAFDIFNSHNGTYNDRWVSSFSITAANSVASPGSCETGAGTCGLDLSGPTTSLVSGTLLFDTDPITAQTYTVSQLQAFRYLRFDGARPEDPGVGINELHVFGMVPEPSTLLLFSSGLIGLARTGRQRRS